MHFSPTRARPSTSEIAPFEHLLTQIPHKEPPRDKVKLPKRQKRGGYREPDYPFKFIKEVF